MLPRDADHSIGSWCYASVLRKSGTATPFPDDLRLTRGSVILLRITMFGPGVLHLSNVLAVVGFGSRKSSPTETSHDDRYYFQSVVR